MNDDPTLNTPCRHGNSPVTCVPCLNDAVDESSVLAALEVDALYPIAQKEAS